MTGEIKHKTFYVMIMFDTLTQYVCAQLFTLKYVIYNGIDMEENFESLEIVKEITVQVLIVRIFF